MDFTPPKAGPLGREQPAATATLRLIAYGGERPVCVLGLCTTGNTKETTLQLLNDTDLDRVVTLEKLPILVGVLDVTSGTQVVVEGSLDVARRSSRALQVSWRPVTPGGLCESLRWRMTDGARQARLEVRLQGTAVDPPVVRAARTGAGAAAAAKSSVAGSMGPPSRPHMAPPAASKAPPRALSLVRPQPSAAAPPSTGSVAAPAAASIASYPGVPRTSGVLDPSALAAAANVKLPGTPVVSSPHLQNGGRAAVRLLTPLRGASPPVKGCSLTEGGRALDFRRVGSAESKRERGLIAWLNSEVAPVEAAASAFGDGGVEGHAVRRLLGEVSGKAYLYFKRDEGFAVMASKIEAKIALKQLALKDVESTLNDIAQKQQALSILTSYHPFWLAVGLQTVLGKALALSHSNMLALMRPGGEAVPAFLRSYVSEHLLADPDLAARFRCTAFNKQEYWDALGARVLGRVLLLVLLLDRLAQRCDLPAGAPSLFRQDAVIKSSEEVLSQFLQSRLAGAGDVRHSLRVMAYQPDYVQHARDEADFRVHKPSDLRDGTRLAKLLDNLRRKAQPHAASSGTLTAQPSSCSVASSAQTGISSRLVQVAAGGGGGRILSMHEDLLPTMAFPQHTGRPMDEANMRNNCIRLARALQQHGVNLQGLGAGAVAGPRDAGGEGVAKAVADGLLRVDQRISMGLLWQMAMHFKLRKHVDTRALDREAGRLRRAAAAAAASASNAATAAAATAAAPVPATSAPSDDAALMRYFNDPTSQSLLLWVRAACAPHGVAVDNFTWSLADGRALCYLVHSYLPEALSRSRISSPDTPSSADEMAWLTGGTEYVKLETLKTNGWAAVYEMGGAIHDDVLAATYKRSVAANFAAAHEAGEALGVPAMLSAEDFLEDGPDELAAILYVALLGEALLKLTAERRAGYVIMEFLRRRLCWRPSHMHAALQRYKAALRRAQAAAVIQAYWRMTRQRRRFMELRQAACLLQAYSRRRLACRQAAQQRQAAVALQAAWRAHAVRAQLRRERLAAVVVQAAWQGHLVRRALAQQQRAATVIQSHVRRHITQKRYSREVRAASKQTAAVAVQAAWRGFCQRRSFMALRSAVVALQACVRMRQARTRFLADKEAAIRIQAAWRAHQARSLYQRQQQAAVRIQAAWRGVRAREQLAVAYARVLLIQAHARGYLARRTVAKRLQGLVFIQSAWRAEQSRRLVASLRLERAAAEQQHAAAMLQAVVRGHCVRRQLAAQHAAATAIQAWWRMARAQRERKTACLAAVRIQAAFRGFEVRQRLQKQHRAAAVIQCLWHRHQARQGLHAARRAAATIQAAWRAHAARTHFLALRGAVVALQACVRMRRARTRFLADKQAATCIQTAWRAHQARSLYKRQQQAAVRIQAAWRAGRAREQLAVAYARVLLIQAHARGYLARRTVAKRLQGLLLIQSAWRAEQSRRLVASLRLERAAAEQQRAAAVLQAVVRGHCVRRQLAAQHAAATAIQAWWRMARAQRERRRAVQSVVRLQALARGVAARRAFGAVREAAMVMQRLWRVRLAMREYAQAANAFWAREGQKQAEMMIEISRQYLRGLAAAARIKAHWRGYQARKAFAPVWAQHLDDKQARKAAITIQAAWRSYAARKRYGRMRGSLAVIGSLLVPLYRARKKLALRRQAHGRTLQAVLTIQSCARMWLARRRLLAAACAATKIQAVWRGHAVRLRDGRAKREARRRLELAAVEAAKVPSRQIGNRAREALELLRANKNLTQVMQAVEVIETATRYSRDCCKLIARNNGVTALLRFLRSLNRSKPHVDVLTRTLAVMQNICRYDEFLPDVFHGEDCLVTLSERLQFFRDTEEVFNPTVAVLQRLASQPELAVAVPVTVRHKWEGIHQVQFRKADMERKYLERLEGDKGSDVSARESTRKLLVMQQQVVELDVLIGRVAAAAGDDRNGGAQDVTSDRDKDRERDSASSSLGRRQAAAMAGGAPPVGGGASAGAAAALGVAPIPGLKNTIVKNVVQRMAGATAATKRGTGAATGAAGSPGQTARRVVRRLDV